MDLATAARHPLIQEACSMGFDKDRAVAALLSYATGKTAAACGELTVPKHGDAFVDFLFSYKETPAAVLPQTQHTAQQHQQRSSRQGLSRACKRSNSAPQCSSSSTETDDISSADSDFIPGGEQLVMDDSVGQHSGGPPQPHEDMQQQQQQPRKRLRRSCDVAQQAAAAANSPCQTWHGSSIADAINPPAAAAMHTPARAAALAGDVGPTSQQVASRKSQLAAADPGTVLKQAAQPHSQDVLKVDASNPNASTSSCRSKAAPRLRHQQQAKTTPMHADVKQPKQSAGTAAGGQAKLERFFAAAGRGTTVPLQLRQSTQPQQQQQQCSTHAADCATAASTRDPSVPNPLDSSGRPHRSFASLLNAAPGHHRGPAAHNAPAKHPHTTPAAAVNNCQSNTPQPGPTHLHGSSTGQMQPGTAAAAGAPWWRPLTADESSMDTLDLVNLKVFGHRGFRPAQREIAQQAVQGRDLFVLMPTGGGKSLCYQLPAVMMPGVTVVVCPLLSLMQDQVRTLCHNPNGGIPATFLSSQQSASDAKAVKDELRKVTPTIKLLYVTPEQLVKSTTLRFILRKLSESKKLARFVIDEAHCVSTWGHDFRPDYKALRILRAEFKNTPITAVTATATAAVQADILSTLGISRTVTVHQTSFLRPNLLLKVVPKVMEVDDDSGMKLYMVKLIQYIKARVKPPPTAAAAQTSTQAGAAAGGSSSSTCSGIVYCLSRKEAEGVAAVLREEGGINAEHYHAGMTPKRRMEVQNAFHSGSVQVIVATIAFGMGIDKPDVRFVVHFCLSKSLEGYYQEAGRAGRDGAPAECVLMYSPLDVNRHMHIIRMSLGGHNSTRRFSAAVDQLEMMRLYALNSEKKCRHAQLLEYFGVLAKDLPSNKCELSCDVCREDVVPLNPEEWREADEDGLCPDGDACIDLLDEEDGEHDEGDIAPGQQQQTRSKGGGRRRRPIFAEGVRDEEECSDGGVSETDLSGSDELEDEGAGGTAAGSDSGQDDSNMGRSSDSMGCSEDEQHAGCSTMQPERQQGDNAAACRAASLRQQRSTMYPQQRAVSDQQHKQWSEGKQHQHSYSTEPAGTSSCCSGFKRVLPANLAKPGQRQQQQQQTGKFQPRHDSSYPCGVGSNSARFDMAVPTSLARPRQAKTELLGPKETGRPGMLAAGFSSASTLLYAQHTAANGVGGLVQDADADITNSSGHIEDLEGRRPTARGAPDQLQTATAAPAVSARVGPWVLKKRLGVAAGWSRGGSSTMLKKPSPGDALARDLQNADECDMF